MSAHGVTERGKGDGDSTPEREGEVVLKVRFMSLPPEIEDQIPLPCPPYAPHPFGIMHRTIGQERGRGAVLGDDGARRAEGLDASKRCVRAL